MRMLLTSFVFLVAVFEACAQVGLPPPASRIELYSRQKADALAQAAPDFGYIVQGSDGKLLKAFGPETPVTQDASGKIQIIGGALPLGAYVKTEDGLTYLNAVQTLARDEPKGSAESAIAELVDNLNKGSVYIKEKLCPHPARPSKMTMEVTGGFSFGVQAAIKSTVDWDLDKVCASPETALKP